MRATKAYIASLGTTGVLLAAALLMLAVVGAVVAFNRWPNGHVSTNVRTVLIGENARSFPIQIVPTRGGRATGGAGATRAALRAGGPAVVHLPGAGVRSLQRLAAERVANGGHPSTPNGGGKLTLPPNTPQLPQIPEVDPRSISGEGLAGAVADQMQSTSGQAGGSVGKVNSGAGTTVTASGAQAADAVRSLPLPGQLFH
jgi:hypothetical protein